MTRLLVSVRDAAEARMAVEAGVDLVDLKEPNRGPLGLVDLRTMREVVEIVAGRVPLSVALGELIAAKPEIVAALPTELSYAKLGLAGCGKLPGWPDRLATILEKLPPPISPVAVIYADHYFAAAPTAEDVLTVAGRLGCRAVLVDTFDKSRGDLFAHRSRAELGRIATTARQVGLMVVLAGSLSLETVPLALEYEPDYVAVRGAACSGSRTGTLDADCLQRLVEMLAPRGKRRSSATINVG